MKKALEQERRLLQPIRALADMVVDSSQIQCPRVALAHHGKVYGRQHG